MYAAMQGKCVGKAAGEVRTIEQVLEFLKPGARRFGSTRTDPRLQTFRDRAPQRQAESRQDLPTAGSAPGQ